MLREIRRVQDERLVLHIPKEYIHRELEILVFPVRGDDKQYKRWNAKAKIKENLKNFRLLMDKAEKSNFTLSKDVDIDGIIDEMNNDIY